MENPSIPSTTSASYYTSEGELKTSSPTEEKSRIFLGKEQNEALAVRVLGQGEKPPVFSSFKYVKLNVKEGGETTAVQTNVRSLAKRLNVSSLKILRLARKGELSEFVETRTAVIEKQISETRVLSAKVEKEIKGEQGKKVSKALVKQAWKTEKLASGIFVDIGKTRYVAQKGTDNDLVLAKYNPNQKVLGEGSFGKVMAATILENGEQRAVFKFAKKESRGSEADLRNEHKVLNELNKKGTEKGIQQPTKTVVNIQHSSMGVGYIAPRYQYDLFAVLEKEVKLTKGEGIQCVRNLVEGLTTLHKNNRVHGDIKPENSCRDDNGFALSDFGGVRDKDSIKLKSPWGTYTPTYTHKKDLRKLLDLSETYKRRAQLDKLANGEVKNHKEQREILYNAIINKSEDGYNITQQKKLEQCWEEFKKTRKLDPNELSDFKLTQAKIAEMKDQAIETNKKRDVYSLGRTLVQILVPNQKQPENTTVCAGIAKQYSQELQNLLEDMVKISPDKRPTMEEVKERLSKMNFHP